MKAWIRSLTIRGVALGAAGFALTQFGLPIDAISDSTVQTGGQLAYLLGTIMAVIGRKRAAGPL